MRRMKKAIAIALATATMASQAMTAMAANKTRLDIGIRKIMDHTQRIPGNGLMESAITLIVMDIC